jgi:hypothetical protein
MPSTDIDGTPIVIFREEEARKILALAEHREPGIAKKIRQQLDIPAAPPPFQLVENLADHLPRFVIQGPVPLTPTYDHPDAPVLLPMMVDVLNEHWAPMAAELALRAARK